MYSRVINNIFIDKYHITCILLENENNNLDNDGSPISKLLDTCLPNSIDPCFSPLVMLFVMKKKVLSSFETAQRVNNNFMRLCKKEKIILFKCITRQYNAHTRRL